MSACAAHVTLAKNFLDAGNLPTARIQVGHALALQPDSIEALLIKWSIEYESGDFRASLRIAEQLVAHHPSIPEVAYVMAFSLIVCGEKEKANIAIEHYAKVAPARAESRDMLRLCYVKKFGRVDEILQAVAEMRITHGESSSYDGAELLQLTRRREGTRLVPLARKMLKNDPNEASAHFALAVYYLHIGCFARARHYARSYVRAKPKASLRGKEIIFASYVGSLPPFLIVHGRNCIFNSESPKLGGWETKLHYWLSMIAFACMSFIFWRFAHHLGGGGILTAVILCWASYLYWVFPDGHKRYRHKMSEVQLRDDY